jgi:hypothetical protein
MHKRSDYTEVEFTVLSKVVEANAATGHALFTDVVKDRLPAVEEKDFNLAIQLLEVRKQIVWTPLRLRGRVLISRWRVEPTAEGIELARALRIFGTDALTDAPQDPNGTLRNLTPLQRDCIKALRERDICDLEKAINLSSSQNAIAKWTGHKFDATLKKDLSGLVAGGIFDNTQRHRRRGGYFLTAKGRSVGDLLSTAKPQPAQLTRTLA